MNNILNYTDDSKNNSLYEFNVNEFFKILPYYKKTKYQIPMIQSVIDGKLIGRIFADDRAKPETIVIVTNFNWMYVIGNQESELFKNKFCNFINNEFVAKSEQFAWFGLSKYWQDKLRNMFGENVKSFPRIRYEFNEKKYREETAQHCMPEGYKLKLIDKTLISESIKFFDGIKMFWETGENFLSNSFGFCMLYNSEIISICQALAIVGKTCEIDVFTQEEHRGHELAYYTCSAFIEHCLKLGLKPYWETVRANTSSCKLAEKLGFVEIEEYPFYAWFKNV